MKLQYQGEVYETSPAQKQCFGCAFRNDLKSCNYAISEYSCASHKIVWVRKQTEEQKPTTSSFEQKLRELLTEELKFNNRKIVSIYTRNHLANGSPLTLEIDYEHTV